MYWLLLDKSFYAKPQIEEIKKLDGGKDFIIVYCLLLLNAGDKVPCDKKEIGRIAGVSEETAAKAMNAFYRKRMLRLCEEPPGRVKPDFREVKRYAQEIGSHVDIRKFYRWYEAENFEYKGRPIDWKAKLRQWSESEKPRAEANPFIRLMKEQIVEHS